MSTIVLQLFHCLKMFVNNIPHATVASTAKSAMLIIHTENVFPGTHLYTWVKRDSVEQSFWSEGTPQRQRPGFEPLTFNAFTPALKTSTKYLIFYHLVKVPKLCTSYSYPFYSLFPRKMHYNPHQLWELRKNR